MKLGDIYTRLVQGGVLEKGQDTYHGLQVALADAVKRGDAERVSPGVYMVDTNGNKAPTLTDFQSGDGDGS